MQVIITISAAGQSKVETRGLTGTGCQSLTRDIERALGRTERDEKKPEFFQTADTRQEQRQ